MNIINFLLHFIFAEQRRCAVPLLTGSSHWVECERISQQAALWRISTLGYLKSTPIELHSPESHMKTIRKTPPLKILCFYTTLWNKIASATPRIYKPTTQLNLCLLPSYLSLKGISLRSPFVHRLLGQSLSHIPLSPLSTESKWGCSWGWLSVILRDYCTLLRLTPWKRGSRKPMHITRHAICLYQRVPKYANNYYTSLI